ncbi:MAG: pseudouridine-5'-phosphate glycosidase [Firmicutes bacterium]|nr:pseudouridine-5'-phosphate glycosidase [Bacillota bacterium]
MNYLEIKPEVKEALEQGRSVVALESTIIAHGMPYPRNVETALAVENVIREHGAVPATVAIIDGVIKVGLSPEEIEYLGTAKGVLKVSRRDMPLVISKKMDGATTVAGTMMAAAMAGIKVFVTGGIGGVHRGAGESFDISADLEEFKTTNVTVVCAGCKSILDIPATMEYLETKGVPVVCYRSDEIPAFYSRRSGVMAELRMDDPQEIADMIKAKDMLQLPGGVLVTCPVPEEDEIPFEIMDAYIQEALADCERDGVTGKRITPYLLSKVKDLTEGRSLEANIKLVLNNAAVGAEIAKGLAK